MKRTYQPHRRKGARKYGFLARSSSRSGRKILQRRRKKRKKTLGSCCVS